MRKPEHIEKEIRELSAAEFAELRDWILEQDWKSWDAQPERDVAEGKLEGLVAEARQEYAARRFRPLLSRL